MWMKKLEENRYKKVYNSDARRVSWMVNNEGVELSEMPKSMSKKWTKAQYGRERYLATEFLKSKSEQLSEAITGSDRKIMMMIVRDILENLKKAGAKKPSNQIGRGVLSILRAMTYTPDNANYKNFKKYFPKTFNSKLTQKRVAQFHKQTDKVQLTMVKQAMNKVLGEGKLTEKIKDKKLQKAIDDLYKSVVQFGKHPSVRKNQKIIAGLIVPINQRIVKMEKQLGEGKLTEGSKYDDIKKKMEATMAQLVKKMGLKSVVKHLVGKGGMSYFIDDPKEAKKLQKYLQSKIKDVRLINLDKDGGDESNHVVYAVLFEGKLTEKIKPKQKISKKEWSKIKKFNKHIGQDGTHYVTQLDRKLGTILVPVIVEEKLTENKIYSKKDGLKLVKKIKSKDKTVYKVDKQKATYGGKKVTMYVLYTKNKNYYSGNNPHNVDMAKGNGKNMYLVPIKEQLNEAKMVQLQIPVRDKLKVNKILKKVGGKMGKNYEFGVGKAGTFILELDTKLENKVLELMIKNRIQVKEV